jgi:hypothetical protein
MLRVADLGAILKNKRVTQETYILRENDPIPDMCPKEWVLCLWFG